MTRHRFASGLIAALLLTLTAFAQPTKPNFTAAALAETDGVAPGGVQRYAVQLTIPETWHVNAHEPLEEYLIATELTLDAPDGVTVEQIVYPEAELAKFSFSEDEMAVYEGVVNIGVQIRVAESAALGEQSIPASVRYQACNDTTCLAPATLTVELPLHITDSSGEPAHSDGFGQIEFGETDSATEPVETEPEPETTTTDGEAWRELLPEFTIAGQAGGYLKTQPFLDWVNQVEGGERAVVRPGAVV